jgi:hypothetical protein
MWEFAGVGIVKCTDWEFMDGELGEKICWLTFVLIRFYYFGHFTAY